MIAFRAHPGALAPAPPTTNHKRQTKALKQMQPMVRNIVSSNVKWTSILQGFSDS